MINLKIGDKKCKIPNAWDQITLGKYEKIYQIIKDNEFKEPEQENEFMSDEEYKIVEDERALNNVKINQLVFQELTGIDKQTINRCDNKDMQSALLTMSNFLNSDVTKSEYIDGEKKSFTYKNKKYFFPVAKMQTSTFGDFIETAQLNMLADKAKAGRFSVIGEQMAILCREDGEEYDEQKVIKKTKLFKNLTMDVVWDFVFFLTTQTNIYKKNTRTFLKTETEMKTDTQPQIGIL